MRVFFFYAPMRCCRIGASDCEECEREDFENDTPRIYPECNKEIPVGAEATKLINVDAHTKIVAPEEYGEVKILHRHCADAYTMEYDEYFENIHE